MKKHLRIFTGDPDVQYSRSRDTLVVVADDVVVLVPLKKILDALAERDVYCKCIKD